MTEDTRNGQARPPEEPRVRLLLYSASGNLGDMIQTAAMSRLLPQSVGIFRHRVHEMWHRELPFVVNGYLNQSIAPEDANCLFAGVFVGTCGGDHRKAHYEWLRRSRFPVGARDPHTEATLRAEGIEARLLGCATLTLAPYSGPRSGVYSVDVDGPGKRITQKIARNMTYDAQWDGAIERLTLLREAEEVHTTRLHVALPCLAMGTPVMLHAPVRGRTLEPERFSILEAFGLPFDELVTMDTSTMRRTFTDFLRQNLGGLPVQPGDFKKPVCDE
jgi:hypothetical protein